MLTNKSLTKAQAKDFKDLHDYINTNPNASDVNTKKSDAATMAKDLQLENTSAAANTAYAYVNAPPAGYMGNYIARGSFASTSGSVWATQAAPADIQSTDVTLLNLDKFIETAKLFDGDVDGVSESNSSNTVKEGEERFIIGASYLGTRGVSITEVSGALGSFVHGKRVNWTDGDIWVRQTIGKMYKTDLETDSFDYQLTAKNIVVDRSSKTIKLQTKASDSLFVTNAADALLETRTSAGRLHNFAFSNASASVTATAAAFSFAAASVQTSTTICAATSTATISPFIFAYNLGLFRLSIDSTIVTAQISQYLFFNVAKNSVSAYETLTEKMNLKVSAADIEAKNTLHQLLKTTSSVVEVGASCYRGQTRVSQLELKNQKARMSTSKVGIAIEESQATLEKHQAQVIQNTFTTWT